MSEILSNIVIEQTNINFSPNNNNINITPEPTALNIFTGGLAIPGGNAGELQYNNGTLAGIPTVTYISGNLSLGNVSNVKITGGSNNFFLKTDGTGNLTWSTSGGVGNSIPGQLLYNNSNIVTGVSNTSVSSGTLTFTNLSNLKINGGTNGYVLQTDGTGNLTWTAQTGGGGGNGSPGGSNTQIQYNDSGSFGGSAGFTFNETSNLVSMPGNLNIAGTYIGNADGLTNIPGANVTGTVANATYAANAGNASTANTATTAITAGTVTTNAQPNITSVGTLTNIAISGTTSIYEAIENVSLISPASGLYAFNVLDGSIQYASSNATGNITLNVVGNGTTTLNSILGNGKSTTISYVLTNGANIFGITTMSIDNNLQNVKFATSTIPVANAINVYTYTIIKTSTTPTYTVLGSLTRYI